MRTVRLAIKILTNDSLALKKVSEMEGEAMAVIARRAIVKELKAKLGDNYRQQIENEKAKP